MSSEDQYRSISGSINNLYSPNLFFEKYNSLPLPQDVDPLGDQTNPTWENDGLFVHSITLGPNISKPSWQVIVATVPKS